MPKVNGLLAFNADHLVDSNARVNQPEIFEEWAAQADINMIFEA